LEEWGSGKGGGITPGGDMEDRAKVKKEKNKR